MRHSIRNRHVTLGIVGATAMFALITLLIWAFSLGMTFGDYAWTFMLLFPIPIITGSVAGILVSSVWHDRRSGSFMLGLISMGASVVASVLVASNLFSEVIENDIGRFAYLLSSYAILITSGIVIQLILIGSVLSISRIARIWSK